MVMYLSKVLLQDATQPYQWHRNLWALFPDQPDASRPFLFRLERQVRGGAEVLMQSSLEPVASGGCSTVIATRPFQPQVAEGQPLRFRLVANPVKTIQDESGRMNGKGRIKSCRVPLIDEQQQSLWLQKKLDGVASLQETMVMSRKVLHFRKGGKAGKIVQTTFEGVLRVESPERFWNLQSHGIGPAKAFGCGLLTLARL
ncbi:type I-E CRISPR-associated protein Cas6/Cse3/CasE [Ectothiorhodospira magna]|nr:type I-E CRISPR-associated protein Cas6/Cse3/CasE [Ectothiorhodospira magna]